MVRATVGDMEECQWLKMNGKGNNHHTGKSMSTYVYHGLVSSGDGCPG